MGAGGRRSAQPRRAHRGIGTRSRIVDGRYTGELEGPFCYAEGKVEAITAIAQAEGFDLDRCWAYSDSASDLPMLRAAGHPVAVNPDARLAREAATEGWPVVRFHRRTRAVVRRTSQSAAAVGLVAAGFVSGMRWARSH